MIHSASHHWFACTAFSVFYCATLQADPASVTSGSVARLIQAEIPAPPPGYQTTQEVMLALSQKIISPIAHSIEFADVEMQRNLRYSDAAGERGVLDLYSPKEVKTPRLGLICVHGGGWKAGAKEDYRYYGQQFAHRGFVVACINYRLVPQSRFPHQIQDVKCAVRWMRAHATEFNIDPDHIGILGGSAGGHLALLAAYASDVSEFEGIGGSHEFSSQVQAVVDIYGPTDLSADFAHENDMVPTLIRDFLGKTDDEVAQNLHRASPLTYLGPQSPPTLILHGTIDNLVPIAQSDQLAERLGELQVPYVYDRLPGWPHAMDIAKPVNDRVLFLSEHFLKNVLGGLSELPQ